MRARRAKTEKEKEHNEHSPTPVASRRRRSVVVGACLQIAHDNIRGYQPPAGAFGMMQARSHAARIASAMPIGPAVAWTRCGGCLCTRTARRCPVWYVCIAGAVVAACVWAAHVQVRRGVDGAVEVGVLHYTWLQAYIL